MSVIHSTAVSKVSDENLSVRVLSLGLLRQGCLKCIQPVYYIICISTERIFMAK
jgi:hypothetical protein